MTLSERLAAGKELRQKVRRKTLAKWKAASDRHDAVEILAHSNEGRLPELAAIRYGRMLRNPFAFLRGSAGLMARDLAQSPVTGIDVQVCGDCHLSNFGLFATPERNLIFDLNDFDETLHAPWEWDVKRLAASCAVAGRTNGFSEPQCREIATACARSYRKRLWEFASLSPLEIRYARLDAQELIANADNERGRRLREEMAIKARGRSGERIFPKITECVDGKHQFIEQPPITTRVLDEHVRQRISSGLEAYRQSLAEDRRSLFDQYRLEDVAFRVVGVGSVGTRCYVALFFCGDTTPLLLQLKEARRSALEPFAGNCVWDNQGQRVVEGQRLMQAASDIFLGWCRDPGGRDFYVRQLRDMKFSVPVEDLTAANLVRYAEICGWALALAHARSGIPGMISGYLGRGERFDSALGDFALAYADQTEQDHAALAAAARTGRIEVDEEAD